MTLSKCLPRSRSQTLRLPNERVVLEPLAFEIPSTLSERRVEVSYFASHPVNESFLLLRFFFDVILYGKK